MFKEILTAINNILYPKNCHICSGLLKGKRNAYDNYICASCVASMRKMQPAYCSFCGSISACYHYEGQTRELIHKFKFADRPYLSKTIAKLMSEAINPEIFQKTDYLVPVPLHPARRRERGFNQSELIAEDLSPIFKKPVLNALGKIKHTQPQASLTENERLSNLKGAFILKSSHNIKDKHLLLIDDVITTTATIKEAVRILRTSGAGSISVLAFAKG